ncbi:dienelactone hydrolase family protein [Actinoplanes sp. NPDC024001]|uniref:alpha/beta hydrolase family protein n=1 Tax=Actinoplanes sp. NPDC024001 TaxID=3154598 RepID=UPI0033ED5A95
MSVRSVWWAATIPGAVAPFDTAHLRVFYPSLSTGSDSERLSGVFPADPSLAPYPVVVLVSGVNVGQEAYRWLAVELASRGFVAVTYDWVGELFGGLRGITPGVELAAARPDAYGTRATTPSVPAVLSALTEVSGPVAGLLDLENVGLVGHSAGGTVILQSARFFPTVKAVAAYGTHTMVATMLGWPAGTVLPAQVDCPVLLMNGENDGVINGSADRYGEDASSRRDPISRTFDEALPRRNGENLQVTFGGANHFGIAHPVDPTAARAFLDEEATTDPAATRAALADVTAAFLDIHLRGASGDALDKALQNPDIAGIRRR